VHRKTGWLLAGFIILGLAACGATKTYLTNSIALERQVVIDGKADDWVGALSFMTDAKLEAGFLNDADYLYVCIVTDDNAVLREIAGAGLTVWFDPQGGEAKALGVRYPMGRTRPRRQAKPGSDEAPPEPPTDEPVASPGSGLEILKAGGSPPETMDVSAAKGIEVAYSSEPGHFVYELKIPLQASADRPYAVGAQPGSTVGVGFVVPKMDFGAAEGARRGGPPGEGGGGPPMGGGGGFGSHGRGGAGMGGRGMRSGGMNPEIPEGLKVWTYVKLSTGKAPSPAARVEGSTVK
jgi:hypothetical protein